MTANLSPAAEKVLRAAGWHPERHEQAVAEKLVKKVLKAQQRRHEEPSEPFPMLYEVLAVYGDLHVSNTGPGKTAYREDFNLIPLEGLTAREDLTELALLTIEDERFFPLGAVPELPGKLLLSEHGKVILYSPNGYFLMGKDINEALNNLIEGIDPPVFSE